MTSDKRTGILGAMLDLVVERGFHTAPILLTRNKMARALSRYPLHVSP
jgi:hypothetical protein